MSTGRKKDLIVTAGGKNVSPGPLEDIIRAHPLISQAMVVGDGKPFVGLLVTLDPDALKRWKLNRNIPESRTIEELATEPALRGEIQDATNNANATDPHAEATKRHYILDSKTVSAASATPDGMPAERQIRANLPPMLPLGFRWFTAAFWKTTGSCGSC